MSTIIETKQAPETIGDLHILLLNLADEIDAHEGRRLVWNPVYGWYIDGSEQTLYNEARRKYAEACVRLQALRKAE